MRVREELYKMAKELIFPSQVDPFDDINKVTQQLQQTAQELQVQLVRLDRLHKQNKMAAETLLSFLDEAKRTPSPMKDEEDKRKEENGEHSR